MYYGTTIQQYIKNSITKRYLNNESVASIASDTSIPRSTIYAWIKKAVDLDACKKEVSIKNYRLLENKVIRLQGIIEIMKKANCTARDPLEVKLPALEALQGQYNVHMLCEALDVPRETYYNYIFRNKRTHTWYAKRREELRQEIQRIYDDSHQIFGATKICAVMKERGIRVSKEMVSELMRDMGLVSIRQDAKLLKTACGQQKSPIKSGFLPGTSISYPLDGGGRWIRTTEAEGNRFTVCPI